MTMVLGGGTNQTIMVQMSMPWDTGKAKAKERAMVGTTVVVKVIGGGMRQVGMLAAAGIYALENNIQRLTVDHQHADLLAEGLRNCSWIDKVMKVETNIVIGYMKEGFQNSNFVEKLQKLGVSIVSFGKGRIRMVTHLDVSKEDIDKVISLLKF